MKTVRKEIMPSVYLTHVSTSKFKTGCLSLNLLCQLDEKTAAKNALLPKVLRRGCVSYPDMESLGAALDGLYGAKIEPVVRKKGELQCVGFYCDFVDDAYIPGEKLLEKTVSLLGELLLSPVTHGGRLLAEYVNSEKENHIDRIKSVINDKRRYSVSRMIKFMCADEAYGIDVTGTLEETEKINNANLTARYKKLLRSSRVEIFYCGSASVERVETALLDALKALPRGEIDETIGTEIRLNAGIPKYITEELDVTQGKLVMGFRMGNAFVNADYASIMLFNAVFGGSVNSKLFLNVREKLSLCYYAGSSIERYKGIMLVSSGIEFDKYEEAKNEIMLQLEACRRGDMEEFGDAKNIIISSLYMLLDTMGGLEEFYLGQAVEGISYSPESLAQLVEDTDIGSVAEIARSVELDTVYFLKGIEKGEENGD